jgi:hypothetical protein
VSRRKLSKADYKALQRAAPVGVRYPPGGGRAELRVPNKRHRRKQRKRNDEGGT